MKSVLVAGFLVIFNFQYSMAQRDIQKFDSVEIDENSINDVAEKKDSLPKTKISVGVGPVFEILIPDLESLNNSFNSKYNVNCTFGNLQYLGICFYEKLDIVRKYSFLMNVGFHYLIPQYQKINDSISFQLNGVMFSFIAKGDLVRKLKWLDLNLGGGLEFGNINLMSKGISRFPNFVRSKNSFTRVVVEMETFILLKESFFTFLSIQYGGDISKNNWKNYTPDYKAPGLFNLSGLSFKFGIGFNLNGD